MAKQVFINGRWVTEEEAKRIAEQTARETELATTADKMAQMAQGVRKGTYQAPVATPTEQPFVPPQTTGKMADLVITRPEPPPTEEETLASLIGLPVPQRTPYSVTKTMRTGQRGTVLPPDESQKLADLLDEYKAAGYDKYRLSGGQLVDAETGTQVFNASPEDIARYKEYQRAQLMAGANETGGGYGKTIRIEGNAPTRSRLMTEDITQTPAFKNAVGMATLQKVQAEAEKARRGEVDKSQIPGTIENERVLKRQDLARKGQMAEQSALENSQKLQNFLKQAINQTDWTSAGLVGQATSGIGSTPAANLDSILDSIKARIGFDQLQQMRKESPTGGALGQVAVRELDFLQSVQGSLKQKQSASQLRANLQAILESTARLEADLRKNPPKWNSDDTPRGAPVPVRSEEEAARLPKGTLVIINGRKAVVE